jgi:hypothetical protein
MKIGKKRHIRQYYRILSEMKMKSLMAVRQLWYNYRFVMFRMSAEIA